MIKSWTISAESASPGGYQDNWNLNRLRSLNSTWSLRNSCELETHLRSGYGNWAAGFPPVSIQARHTGFCPVLSRLVCLPNGELEQTSGQHLSSCRALFLPRTSLTFSSAHSEVSIPAHGYTSSWSLATSSQHLPEPWEAGSMMGTTFLQPKKKGLPSTRLGRRSWDKRPLGTPVEWAMAALHTSCLF